MFFEFSSHKVSLLSYIVFGIAGALLVFIAMNARWGLVARAREVSAREGGVFWYLVDFKLPTLFASADSAAPYGGGSAKSIPVLLYHGEGDASTAMPTSVFVSQMKALKDAGWHTITLEQFTAFMKDGTPVPDKSFLLTFDDGRRDTYYAADPVLKDLGFTAVMFVITGFSLPDNSDTPYNNFYLSKAELTAMSESGRWELESHGDEDHREYSVPTATSTTSDLSLVPNEHFLSNKFWLSDENRLETTDEFTTRVTNDLTDSKTTLEEDFGKPVTGFAYPFNDFGDDTENFPDSQAILNQIVPSLYTFAFYQTWPGNGDTFNYPDPSEYLIKRIEPPQTWSGTDLLNALQGGVAKSLPYTATAFGSDWETNWGTLSTGSALTLTSDEDSTGAAAFLDGTQSWTNYRIDASVADNFGTLSIAGRYVEDSEPYATCGFSNDRIYLERHTDGSQQELSVVSYTPPASDTLTVSMSVSGNLVTCSAYGASASSYVQGLPVAGEAGVSVWEPTTGAAHTTLTAFSATGIP